MALVAAGGRRGRGPEPADHARDQHGVGLTSTCLWLQTLYGTGERLTLRERRSGGAVVELLVPDRRLQLERAADVAGAEAGR